MEKCPSPVFFGRGGGLNRLSVVIVPMHYFKPASRHSAAFWLRKPLPLPRCYCESPQVAEKRSGKLSSEPPGPDNKHRKYKRKQTKLSSKLEIGKIIASLLRYMCALSSCRQQVGPPTLLPVPSRHRILQPRRRRRLGRAVVDPPAQQTVQCRLEVGSRRAGSRGAGK